MKARVDSMIRPNTYYNYFCIVQCRAPSFLLTLKIISAQYSAVLRDYYINSVIKLVRVSVGQNYNKQRHKRQAKRPRAYKLFK